MKKIYAAVPLAAAMLLAGCKGFWDPLPSNNGGGGTTPTTLSSGPFYVLNQTTGQIVAYNISSGSLKTIATYSVTGPVDIAIAPNKNFLYVSTLTSGIFPYSINSSGALTPINNQQPLSSDADAAVQVDTTNSWLIDAFVTNGQLELGSIPLNSNGTYTTGTRVPSVTFTISNAAVKQLVLSPQGDYLFLALGNGGAIAIPFNASNSNPIGTTAKVLITPSSNQAVLSAAVDPQQRLFYLGETNSVNNSGGLLAFSYSSLSGTPTQITGSPIASGNLSPSAILAESSGNYVYVANGNNNAAGNVNWFPITSSGASYSIAAGSSISSGIFPVGLAEDNQDNFVLAVSSGGSTSSGNPDLNAYTMSSGALTSAIASSTGSDPVGAVAVAALPK